MAGGRTDGWTRAVRGDITTAARRSCRESEGRQEAIGHKQELCPLTYPSFTITLDLWEIWFITNIHFVLCFQVALISFPPQLLLS